MPSNENKFWEYWMPDVGLRGRHKTEELANIPNTSLLRFRQTVKKLLISNLVSSAEH